MALTKAQKKQLYINLVRAMAMDRMMMRMIRTGKMVGFYHEGGISLAPGIAAGTFLNKTDTMNPHYRAHGLAHMIAKGIDVKSYVAEHMGRVDGCCKGRSSFHVCFPDDHIFGWSGNIGANFPPSIGYGLASKYRKSGQVVMNCSGDGSYQEGRSYEAMALAATWKLPIIFWCENNGISQHSILSDLFPIQDISRIAQALDISSIIVDGQDLLESGEAALKAIKHVRSGNGPFFVELKTLRAQEHNVGGLNYDGDKPRDVELMQEWHASRNPLLIAEQNLLDQKVLTRKSIEQINRDAEIECDEIELFCDQSPKATPSIEELMRGVYAH